MSPTTPTKADLVVLGAGPGGYAAAFYAADLGMNVVLIEQDKLGGVCLNRGCIPSKALLHATKSVHEAELSANRGIKFGKPQIDLDAMRQWKNSIVTKLSSGIAGLAQKRKVQVINGRGHFEDSHTLRVETAEGQQFIRFDKAIIAVGSKPAMPAAFDLGNKRIMTSTEALEIEDIPQELLIVGGGYIGMELGTVYSALGSKVTMVEAMGAILAGADQDLVKPVLKYAEKNYKALRVGTKVTKMATVGKQIKVNMEFEGQKLEELYDKVLVAIGRAPNTQDLGLKNTKIKYDEKGYIKVNKQQQTSEEHIYAIGDVVGGLMLAHKATREARVAVETLSGQVSAFDNVIIPAVVFTDPEIAWCGLTEAEAKQKGIEVHVSRFPWQASGRALSSDKAEGLTKLIIEPQTERILGVGLCGAGAGDMISEGVVAVEMGATVTDLALCVHPHPTFSETIMEAAEAFLGHATHIYAPKRHS